MRLHQTWKETVQNTQHIWRPRLIVKKFWCVTNNIPFFSARFNKSVFLKSRFFIIVIFYTFYICRNLNKLQQGSFYPNFIVSFDFLTPFG